MGIKRKNAIRLRKRNRRRAYLRKKLAKSRKKIVVREKVDEEIKKIRKRKKSFFDHGISLVIRNYWRILLIFPLCKVLRRHRPVMTFQGEIICYRCHHEIKKKI